MLGWLADSFRFAWSLLYWNIRKSWFRFRRGRVACPCQAPSDSGRAYETACDACAGWHRPWRFRRVCPLLVRTKDGPRCSADTADVRPFWSLTLRYYGGAALALYAAGVLIVFGFLRTIGYPVSIVHVALPPLWHRVGQARGWFFLDRAHRAFAAGRTNEGLLYLSNAYDFDPTNFDAGIALAKAYQLANPARSDQVFARLLRDHPEQRNLTAQDWFRSLLARGEFGQIAMLAKSETLRDPRHANAWIRALIFATRQNQDTQPLKAMLADPSRSAEIWRPLLETELLWRAGRKAEVRAAIDRPWPATAPPFTVVYRVEMLTELGDPMAALDLLEKHRPQLDDEAWLTLRLDCLAAAQARQALRSEFQAYLLSPPLTQPLLKIMCAQLIRHPDRALFAQLSAKFAREHVPLDDNTAGGWFSLLCTAGAVGDTAQLRALVLRLRNATQTPFTALQMLEAFFRGDLTDRRATTFLPFLPVPIEVSYALIERYPGAHKPARLSP
ncbi:MAG TPA: hypothetical protein VHE61_19045 [Opitutaceae bacterium]|nr:hypothetical protein [Opitutaceae bacterium]